MLLLPPAALLSLALALLSSPSSASPLASPNVADPSDGSHTICAVRELAYERAMAVQPHRGELVELFDALELHTLCGVQRPSAQTAAAPPAPGSSSGGGQTLHVDPVAGDDAIGAPFRTVGAAVREARRRQIKSLVLADGIHFLNETLNLTAADSGFSVSAASGANVSTAILDP